VPDERDKPHPGAVPVAFAPHQVTAPHPWGYQPPPHDLKPSWLSAMDVAKLLGLVVTIGTIIFGAGKLVAKLENIEASQKSREEQQAHRTRRDDDRYEKLKSAVDGLGDKVESLTEQVKQARAPRWRRREAGGIDTKP
jgi:hypothetical protein